MRRMTTSGEWVVSKLQRMHEKKCGHRQEHCGPGDHDWWHDEFASHVHSAVFTCIVCGYSVRVAKPYTEELREA